MLIKKKCSYPFKTFSKNESENGLSERIEIVYQKRMKLTTPQER